MALRGMKGLIFSTVLHSSSEGLTIRPKHTMADTKATDDPQIAIGDDESAAHSCDTTKDETHGDPCDRSNVKGKCQCMMRRFAKFYASYQFPLHIIIVIALARAYPPLGADYLKPEITATWIAVAIIFTLSGLGLKTQEFSQAFQRLYFNGFVQIFNFFFVSAAIFGLSRVLVAANMLKEELGDGMVICGSLPMAINVVIVLTASTGGDEAAAVFNATLGNIVGIFLSPVLILMYLGTTGSVSMGEVFYKLTLRVVVPLIIGQLMQRFWNQAHEFYRAHKRPFKKLQESCLVFIVYTVFCRTFEGDASAGIGNVLLMVLYQLLIMLGFMAIAWIALRYLFPDNPELRVMGVFGCVQKTVALGVPLINTIYEGSPNEGLYTLPILIWHPMQLVVGSMLVPRLAEFVRVEQARLLEREKPHEVDVEEPPVEACGEEAQ